MRNYLNILFRQLLILSALLLGVGTAVRILFLQFPKYKYTDVNKLAASKGVTNFAKTKILFAFPTNPTTIWDEYNKLYRIYGALPTHISVVNNTRVLTFIEPAILKSDNDSIDIEKAYISYEGYMGITTDERKFLVNSQGEIYEISPEHLEPRF
ncbi:MAG: hypothetical protein ACAF41_14605 [Leptolyngbya sp. BL-A-14]